MRPFSHRTSPSKVDRSGRAMRALRIRSRDTRASWVLSAWARSGGCGPSPSAFISRPASCSRCTARPWAGLQALAADLDTADVAVTVTNVHVAQGRRFATHTAHSAPQAINMQHASHVIELPSSGLSRPNRRYAAPTCKGPGDWSMTPTCGCCLRTISA